MINKYFLLLSIISVLSINFDFDSFHHHKNCENNNHAIIECEDCKFIDNDKNNLIENVNQANYKNDSKVLIFVSSDKLIFNKFESKKLSRAPPKVS